MQEVNTEYIRRMVKKLATCSCTCMLLILEDKVAYMEPDQRKLM